MNYEEMSDFDLNLKLSELALIGRSDFELVMARRIVKAHADSGSGIDFLGAKELSDLLSMITHKYPVKYCTDWNATYDSIGNYWTCGKANFKDGVWEFDKSITGECVDHEAYDKNPLRAIVICLIKVLEAKNNG